MKLLKKTNYPAYTVDNVDDVVLRDANGVPLICSHDFDKIESGMLYQKMAEAGHQLQKCPSSWHVAFTLFILSHKRS